LHKQINVNQNGSCLVTKSSSTVPYNYTKPFPVQDAVVSIGYFAMDLQTIL